MTTEIRQDVDIPLEFHKLSFLQDGDDVVIGRTDVDSYAVFPPDGAVLVQRLVDGMAPRAAAEWYEREFGETVDIDDLIETLKALGLLASPGDELGWQSTVIRGRRFGQVLFSGPALLAYAAFAAFTGVIVIRHPWLAPRRDNIFFTHWLLVVDLVVMFGQLPLALLHEAGHVLAGRRLGVRSRIRVSRRLYFVVFETVLDGLVTVARRSRYLPLLAGLLADVVSMAGLTLVAWLLTGPHQHAPLVARICLALAFTAVPRIAWQFCVFLRTDIYYLGITALGCTDLQGATRQRLAELANMLRLPPWMFRIKSVDPETWHARDRQVARWFVIPVIGGYIVMLAILAEVVGPLAWQFVTRAVYQIGGGHGGVARSADATAILGLMLVQVVVALVIDRRERKAEGRANPASDSAVASPQLNPVA